MDACARMIQTLKAAGIPAYPPATAVGECKAPYVVVRPAAAYGQVGGRVQRQHVNVYVFVPNTPQYSVQDFAGQVKAALAPLATQIMPTNYESPEVPESDYKARSKFVEYIVLRAT